MRLYLRKLRTEKGYTQQEVASHLGISRRMYGLIETGSRNPSWNVQKRMVKFFNIPIEELLDESDEINTKE